jgi:hypothetical protein
MLGAIFIICIFLYLILIFGSYSCCSLYLFLAKEARKRMPLPSGLGLHVKN